MGDREKLLFSALLLLMGWAIFGGLSYYFLDKHVMVGCERYQKLLVGVNALLALAVTCVAAIQWIFDHATRYKWVITEICAVVIGVLPFIQFFVPESFCF